MVLVQKPIGVARRRSRHGGNRASPRISEADAPVGKLLNGVAALVHEAVVASAQENQIVELRLAPLAQCRMW